MSFSKKGMIFTKQVMLCLFFIIPIVLGQNHLAVAISSKTLIFGLLSITTLLLFSIYLLKYIRYPDITLQIAAVSFAGLAVLSGYYFIQTVLIGYDATNIAVLAQTFWIQSQIIQTLTWVFIYYGIRVKQQHAYPLNLSIRTSLVIMLMLLMQFIVFTDTSIGYSDYFKNHPFFNLVAPSLCLIQAICLIGIYQLRVWKWHNLIYTLFLFGLFNLGIYCSFIVGPANHLSYLQALNLSYINTLILIILLFHYTYIKPTKHQPIKASLFFSAERLHLKGFSLGRILFKFVFLFTCIFASSLYSHYIIYEYNLINKAERDIAVQARGLANQFETYQTTRIELLNTIKTFPEIKNLNQENHKKINDKFEKIFMTHPNIINLKLIDLSLQRTILSVQRKNEKYRRLNDKPLRDKEIDFYQALQAELENHNAFNIDFKNIGGDWLIQFVVPIYTEESKKLILMTEKIDNLLEELQFSLPNESSFFMLIPGYTHPIYYIYNAEIARLITKDLDLNHLADDFKKQGMILQNYVLNLHQALGPSKNIQFNVMQSYEDTIVNHSKDLLELALNLIGSIVIFVLIGQTILKSIFESLEHIITQIKKGERIAIPYPRTHDIITDLKQSINDYYGRLYEHNHHWHITADASELLIDKLQEAILVCTKDSRIIDCNIAAENLFGYTMQVIKQKRISDLLFHQDPNHADILQKYFKLKAKGQESHIVVEGHNQRGSVFTIQFDISKTVKDNKEYYYVIIYPQTLESTINNPLGNRINRTRRLKDLYVDILADEIEKPVNIINAATNTLKKHVHRDESQTLLDSIAIAHAQLKFIIGDVLDLTQLEVGRLSLAEEKINLHTVCHDVIHILNKQAKESHKSIKCSIDEKLDTLFLGDSLRIKRALYNSAKFLLSKCTSAHISIRIKPLLMHSKHANIEFAMTTDLDNETSKQIHDILDEELEPSSQPGTRKQPEKLSLFIVKSMLPFMEGKIKYRINDDKKHTITYEINLKTSAHGIEKKAYNKNPEFKVDYEQLDNLKSLIQNDFGKLILNFYRDYTSLIEAIKFCRRETDKENVKILLNTMSISADNLGLNTFSQELMKTARKIHEIDLDQELETLQENMNLSKNILEAYLQDQHGDDDDRH